MNTTLALRTTKFLVREREYTPWLTASNSLNYYFLMFDRSALYGPMQVMFLLTHLAFPPLSLSLFICMLLLFLIIFLYFYAFCFFSRVILFYYTNQVFLVSVYREMTCPWIWLMLMPLCIFVSAGIHGETGGTTV